MKKAQDFLVDSQLGEKSFNLKDGQSEEKIVLSIEERGISPQLLATMPKPRQEKRGNLYSRLDGWFQSLGKPKTRDKATFYRLMSIMIEAGVPLVKALDTVSEQTQNVRFKNSLFDIARFIEKGSTFSQSAAQYSDIFSQAHIGMIRAAEASGQLTQILKQLAVEVEKDATIRRKVKGALMYPVFLGVVMVIVVVGMMVAVVPKIAEIFEGADKELPAITSFVIGLSDIFVENWISLLIGLSVLIGFSLMIRRLPAGRYWTDWILIRLPIFGPIVKKSLLARFNRALSNLLKSGVPITQSLTINADTVGNEVYRRRIQLVSEDIARGIPLGESLRDTQEFPAMMVQMVAVGEQTAQLDTIAAKIAEYYEEEIDVAVAGLSKLLEPLIIVILGAIVAVIVAAIMLPILQLTDIAL